MSCLCRESHQQLILLPTGPKRQDVNSGRSWIMAVETAGPSYAAPHTVRRLLKGAWTAGKWGGEI